MGGVLRASHPRELRGSEAFGACDGDMTAKAVSSFLEDGTVHDLPARSEFGWKWGGSGPLELEVAVRGTVELELNGTRYELAGGADRFAHRSIAHGGRIETITVRGGLDGATVTDLFVYRRGSVNAASRPVGRAGVPAASEAGGLSRR